MDIKTILTKQQPGTVETVSGWLKTRRNSREFSFLEINDGSCLKNLQIIAAPTLTNYDEIRRLATGSSIRVSGRIEASPAGGQDIELTADELLIIGGSPPAGYPLQKKRHSFEFLRGIPHLRPRTNSLGAVMRLRGALNFAVHDYFHRRGYIQVHTPIITTSDCEGAGEMFTVTTLNPSPAADRGFERDFFGRQAGLTVSGQLQAEACALALGRVYTFGPTFRAENSNTSRHLAEFWMIEPEIAFCELEEDINIAEDFLKSLISHALEHCREDLELFDRFISPGLLERLNDFREKDFQRISYGEAVNILKSSPADFNFPVNWGTDLQSEHEQYLCEEVFEGPVVVSDYPAAIKPFYMRLNDDGRTVAAMDLLFPGIGEIVGGSQREERLEVLEERMVRSGMETDQYQWYLDLRRYGTVPHAGFGAGFERIIQLVSGMANIREVIPFPRTPGNADL